MMLPGRRPRGAGRRRTSPETGALRPSRGRTQRHAVVPSDAGSYPNSRGRTLEPFQRTTARIRVRPRNALYDRAYPGTTARPRSPSRMRMGRSVDNRGHPPRSRRSRMRRAGQHSRAPRRPFTATMVASQLESQHPRDQDLHARIALMARPGASPARHRRVTGSASARRHEPDQDRPGLPGRGNETAHWWLGHRGSAPSESRSTSRAPRRPSAPPDNDTALSTKNATRNKDAPPLRGSVLRGRPPPRSGRRRSPCRSSRRAPPRDGRPAADTSPGSAPPDTCDADL